MKKKDPHKLTFDEALSLIEIHMEGKKKRTHSFEGGGFGLFGCDMDLTSVEKQMKESEDIRLAGPNMNGMGHGIGYHRKDRGYTFIKTDMKKVNALIKERKIKDIIR